MNKYPNNPLAHACKGDRILIIIPDRLSDLIRKGETVERYYNPGDLFREVHLLLLNDDQPSIVDIQPLVGNAKLHLSNIPTNRTLFLTSLGWRPRFLRRWAASAVKLAAQVGPQVVRCHGNQLNAYLAFEIKRRLRIPYAISLHGNPDVDYFRGRLGRTWEERLIGRAIQKIETLTVKNADRVFPVYSSILPYLQANNVEQVDLIYNVVGRRIKQKSSYQIDRSNIKIVCVGRQQSLQKDPTPIVEAVAELPNVSLLLIGSGDLHESLRSLVERLHIADRVTFATAVPNNKILEILPSFDFYVYSSINYEISKTCIEAALAGLPVIINDRNGNPASELVGGHFRLVSNDKESYREALLDLIRDDVAREELGKMAFAHAQANWNPDLNESRYVQSYLSLIGK